MENQDANNSNSDGKSCYAPTTNFPPTRSGTCPPTANPFGTVTVQRTASNPRETGVIRSPALKLGALSGSGGGGLVLRPSMLRATGKDKDFEGSSTSNGSAIDPETEERNVVENPEEDSLQNVNGGGDGTSTLSSESNASATEEESAPTTTKELDTLAPTETAVQIESAAIPEPDTKAEEQGENQRSVVISEAPKPNGTHVPTFIFGSNLGARVENAPTFGSGTSDGKASISGLTFATASAASPTSTPSTSSSSEADWKKYGGEERSAKRKFEETEAPATTTGEEEESNVLQASSRLFTFNTTNSSWVERGRGQLRLNDRQAETLTSRLVMRTQGSLRVILNTPVFHGMMTTKVSDKSVKITGLDEGEVKLYLIQCSPSDAETLHSALEWRVRSLAPPSPPVEKVTIHSSHFNVSPKKKRSE